MKKLLTLLLALMLPLWACAETYGLSVSMETDEASFIQLAKEALMMDPTIDSAYVDTYAKLLQKVLNGSGINVAMQDDALALELQLSGGKLFDLTAYEVDQKVYLTSSMLQGYALVGDETEASGEEQALLDELDQTDWTAVLGSMQSGLTEWLSVIEPTVTRGAFEGDAFKGGTQCTTWMLSDMDIAALANRVLTPDMRDVLTSLLTVMSLDAAELLEQFDAINDRVADEDRYLYVLRVVGDDLGRLVGISLTVLDENTQVATVSFGMSEEDARLVVGLGFKGKNYWWEFTANKHQQDNVTRLSGESREWVADKQDGFTYVSAALDPVSDLTWACDVTQNGSSYTWDANVSDADAAIVSANGTVNLAGFSLSSQICLGDAADAPLSVTINIAPAEAIQPLDETLTLCSMSDPEDAEIYDSLIKQISASLLARLMKLLPMDLLLTLNDLTIQ